MADQEAVFSITENYCNIKGVSAEDFQRNVEFLLGPGSFELVRSRYQQAFGVFAQPANEQQAQQNLNAAGVVQVQTQPQPQPAPQAAPAQPAYQPALAQPAVTQVPQPGFQAQPQATAQPAPTAQQLPPGAKLQGGELPPPNLPYPGDCPHGRRAYFSMNPAKTGPNVGKPWPRWECALAYSPKIKDQRCATQSVESR